MSAIMSQFEIGDPAPDVTVPDHTGRPVRLAERWAEKPLVLLFLRHLG